MFEFVTPDPTLVPPPVRKEPCDECIFLETVGGYTCSNDSAHEGE